VPPPTFTQSSTAPALYWLTDASLPQGYGIALLLHGIAGPPQTIDLTQSWRQYPGLYVMTGKKPAAGSEETFIAALRQLENAYGPDLRFVWLADATAPAAKWRPATVLVAQTAGAPSGTISAPAQLPFGSYIVGLAAGLTIAPTSDGFSLSGGGAWAFSLRTPSSVWALSAPATAISFAGAQAGCVLLNLALPQDNGHGGVDDYTRLDAGFRFAVKDPDHIEAGLLLSLRYPVFAGVPAGGVNFDCLFDPALPLSAARTRLAYAAGAPAHVSYYRAALGYGVSMTPQPGDPLPAGLAFHLRPGSLHALASDDPLYLGPIGSFAISVAGGKGGAGGPANPAARLGCGISGTEYFGLSTAGGALISFTPGGDAYAPLLGAPPPRPGAPLQPALTGLATSPWAALLPAQGQQAWYYAQPDDAALYRVRGAGGASSLTPYLVYVELAAGGVGGATKSYPMVPYAGVSAAGLGLYTALEAQTLSPTRRAALTPQSLSGGGSGAVAAVTPQGLLSTFSTDYTNWKLLTLVPLPPQGGATVPPALAFNNLGGAFRQALQTNQLFMVAADGALLGGAADFNYWITDAALEDLDALPPETRPPDAVLATLRASARARTPQVGLASFTAMLRGVLTQSEQQYVPVITQYSVYFEVVIGAWRFRLSPSLWGAQPAAPTIMIFKFAKSDLRSLVRDSASWTWPAAAGDVAATRDRILAIVDDAEAKVTASGGQSNPLDFFVNNVCNDPAWTGVIFLNAQAPFDSMPEELRGLAAGIDAAKFRAHHVGLSLTPAQVDAVTGALSLGASSFFGLIDYEAPDDIAQTFDDFDFKVLQLQVLFRNSAVADFAGRIELFVNRLFGDTVTLVGSRHYNNLILLGSYQRQKGGGGHYVFATGDSNLYACRGAVLDNVEVLRAQFNTLAASPSGDERVHARFLMWGRLRFKQLEGFDLFSFGYTVNQQGDRTGEGYLAFGGLAVEMQFSPSDPTARVFAFNAGDINFDVSNSVARPTGLFSRFPLKLTGLLRGEPGQTPKDRGFEPVETPLAQPALDAGWYALTFAVDLGTLGALAAEAGLVVTLLAAWDATEGRPAVNVGLQLPGSQGLKSLPAIEGVLQLGFQSISFDADGALATPPNPAYVMRLRHFALRLLGWKFPPGQADIYLFGDPEASPGQNGALGWYAAYLKE
jgi:hypothetical protein